MKANEIFDEYKNLDIKDKIIFKRLMNRYDELEKLENLKIRIKIAKKLYDIANENGEPYLSTEWVKKNILKF